MKKGRKRLDRLPIIMYNSSMNERKITKMMTEIEKQMVGLPLYADEIETIFADKFGPLGVEVSTTAYDGIPENTITANGFFDETELEFDEESINIELELVFNNEDHPCTINNKDWTFLKHQITQTLEHEMIHRDQANKRIDMDGEKPMPLYYDGMTEEQKKIVYLSDPDEIDAYANDVALDLLKHYTYMDAYTRLREYKKIRQDESPIFCDYVDTFGWNSEVVHLIVKKALKRLET